MFRSDQDIFNRAMDMMAGIRLMQEINRDDNPMMVGDKVIVWDGSHNKDAKTNEHRSGIDPLFKQNEGVIIENECAMMEDSDPIMESALSNYELKTLDLLISIGGQEVYVASNCVKHC